MKHIATLILLAFIAVPTSSSAYFTTGQEAFTVDSTTGVFLIDFAFGHEKYDVRIPVRALSTDAKNDSSLSFKVLNDEQERAIGNTMGVVLSNAKVENGMYVVPKGKRATFRLLALYTKSTSEQNGTFRATVTHLPFTFGAAQQLQLNPSELEYYTTEPLNLGTAVTFTIGK